MKVWGGGRSGHGPRRQLRHQRGRHRLQHRQPGDQGHGEEDGQGDGPRHPEGLQGAGAAGAGEPRGEEQGPQVTPRSRQPSTVW